MVKALKHMPTAPLKGAVKNKPYEKRMGKTPSVSGVFVWPIESGKRLHSDVFSLEKQAQKAIFREVVGDVSPTKKDKKNPL